MGGQSRQNYILGSNLPQRAGALPVE